MIETSIIMSHYSEDKRREDIARRCIQAVQPHRNDKTEFILIFNGRYSYRDEFIKYCDQWHERDADASPGRSNNIAYKLAKGKILFILCNDVLLYDGAVAECVRLLKKYEKYLVSPASVTENKMRIWGRKLEDGYLGCDRAGDTVCCLTRKQRENVGPSDEVDPWTDGINLANRRLAKGYTVLLTKEPMCENLAPGIHSFKKQQRMLGYRGYKKREPIYLREKLMKISFP